MERWQDWVGFALTENVLYFGSALAEDGWGSWAIVVLLQTIPFGLNHALLSGLTGAGLATAYLHRKAGARFAAPLTALRHAPALHANIQERFSAVGQRCMVAGSVENDSSQTGHEHPSSRRQC